MRTQFVMLPAVCVSGVTVPLVYLLFEKCAMTGHFSERMTHDSTIVFVVSLVSQLPELRPMLTVNVNVNGDASFPGLS